MMENDKKRQKMYGTYWNQLSGQHAKYSSAWPLRQWYPDWHLLEPASISQDKVLCGIPYLQAE